MPPSPVWRHVLHLPSPGLVSCRCRPLSLSVKLKQPWPVLDHVSLVFGMPSARRLSYKALHDAAAGADTMAKKLSISSVSWIDQKPLPKVGFWMVIGAATSWPKRVIMGLVGTSNPAPPSRIENIQTFARGKQYRALISCTVEIEPNVRALDVTLDPGYTPPFDKSKIDSSLRSVAPIPDDPDFHAGEASPISAVRVGKLHPCSSLIVKSGQKVLVSALIKFRAGKHTDDIGIEKANAPAHVPWVWSEFALVCQGSTYHLLCNGSKFPSHVWFVNGESIATILQAEISVSEHDPILNAGQPAKYKQTDSSIDKSSGNVGTHADAIGPASQLDIELKPVP